MAIKVSGNTVIDNNRNATVNTLTIDGTAITATAAELNTLDGITATTAELNFVDGVTSNLQTQLDNITVTSGTLTKSFASGETASIALSSALSPAPVVSATKEVPQTGILSKGAWDVSSSGANYDRLDSAYDTTLTPELLQPLGSATYTNSTVSVSNYEATPAALRFKPDGTKLYVVGYSSDYVNEYTMSTPWDINNANYARRFYVGSQESLSGGLSFNADGTKMFILGDAQDTVYQYTLSTAWLVTSAILASGSKSVRSQVNIAQGLTFNADGTKMYVVGFQDNVYEYDLSSAYDVGTAQYNSVNLTITSQESQARDIYFNANGTKLYVIGTGSDSIHQYGLTTAYDLSTASYDSVSFSVGSQDNSPQSVAFRPDGTYFYTVGLQWDRLREYKVPSINILTLGTGSFAASDVGKTIEGNGGVAVLTAADGSYVETTAFTDSSTIAAGSWSMYSVVVNTADGLEMSSGAANTWDISAAVYSQNFSVAAQDTAPTGVFFKPDGTKMYIVGVIGQDVNEYDLSTAWDISTSVYSQNFSVAAQENSPRDLFFKPDGTKMYITGESGDDVNEYNLSTAWDVSTASFLQNFSVAAQETGPQDLFFKPDGTKMYVTGSSSDRVHEYNLSTAWDVSTASILQNFSVSSQETFPQGLFFKSDGTKMYIVGDDVNEYNLSTAWDVSTASYNQNFSVAAQDTAPLGFFFKPDGTKMYVVGAVGDDVNEYDIGTVVSATGYIPSITNAGGQIDTEYWTDINSMTTDDIAGAGAAYYAVSTDDRTTWSVINEADGVRPIVRDNGGTWQYNTSFVVGSAWDISTSVYSQSFYIGSQDTIPHAVFFKPDGTKMYIVGQQTDIVSEYNLSTAWDVSTSVYSQGYYVGSQESQPQGLFFKPDGTKMYITGYSGDDVNEYNLSTAWDVSTSVYSRVYSVSSQETTPQGLFFKPDGRKMYILGMAGDDVNEYNLSTAWNISTSNYSKNFSIASQETTPTDIFFKPDGLKMYVVGTVNQGINEYNLSTAWDVSTATFLQHFYVGSQESTPTGMFFKPDGLKMYVVGTIGDYVSEYDIGEEAFTTSTTWVNSTTNSELYALQEALTESAPNRMDKAQLEAVTDPNHYTLGDSLDLMIGLYLGSASSDVPSSDGVSINYDAESLNQGAILGTDYDYDFPDSTTVRVTSNAAQNLKVRVV